MTKDQKTALQDIKRHFEEQVILASKRQVPPPIGKKN